MKIGVLSITFLILASCLVSAANLSDYPKFFDKGNNTQITIVKGSGQSVFHSIAALEVLATLPREFYENINNKLDSDTDINMRSDFILIGGPCQNRITKQFVDNPDDCSLGLKEEEILFKLVENGQTVMIIVSAKDSDYRKVGSILRDRGTVKSFQGNKIKVGGKTLEIGTTLEKNTVEVKEEKKEEAEFTDRADQVEKGICGGCVTENGCLSVGDLTSINGKPNFCNENKEFQMQQDLGGSCTKNIECVTGFCKSSKCAEKTWWYRFWIWLTNLF